MSYELVFLDEALKEWHTLNNNIRSQFKNILRERLNNPYFRDPKHIDVLTQITVYPIN